MAGGTGLALLAAAMTWPRCTALEAFTDRPGGHAAPSRERLPPAAPGPFHGCLGMGPQLRI
jgi:hypothetical protein